MTIQIDSREKAHVIEGILTQFRQAGAKYYVSKLYVGDYSSLDNARLVVDRKQNLLEVCSNLTQQHERFREELLRAKDAEIRLVVLIEHGRGVTCIEDVERWKNPRLKHSPKATTGEQLAKMMRTAANRYGVDWQFCEKAETGNRIIEILGGAICPH